MRGVARYAEASASLSAASTVRAGSPAEGSDGVDVATGHIGVCRRGVWIAPKSAIDCGAKHVPRKAQSATRWMTHRRTADRVLRIRAEFELRRSSADRQPSTPWNLTFVADLVVQTDSMSLTTALRSSRGRGARLASRPVAVRPPRRSRRAAGLTVRARRQRGFSRSIGDESDIPRLRDVTRERATQAAGRFDLVASLARRLATGSSSRTKVGSRFDVGQRHVPGSTIRRKVLALLCFLLTRPDCRARETRSSTRFGQTRARSMH